MAKVSVVICVYNTSEEFLKNCLQSVYDSSLKDIEVIVIDDGSTTDYFAVHKIFNKIKYIKTENQGTLKARLLGVSKATSPYICFVDSDDTISFNYLEAELASIEKDGSDIVLNDWAFHTEKSKYICKNDTTICKNICYEDEFVLKKFVMQAGKEHSFYVLWNKLYRADILKEACKKIEELKPEKMSFAEDILINFFVFALSKKVTNVHLGHYYYRMHNSQQIVVNSAEKLKSHILSQSTVFDIMENSLREMGLFDELKIFFDMWKRFLSSNQYAVAKRSKFYELYEYIKKCYNISKIKRVSKSYDKVYHSQKLLPDNIEAIDTQLKKVYYSNRYLKVYAKRNSYAFDSLIEMKVLFNLKFDIVKSKKQATFVFEKEKVSLKKRILHNPLLYGIAVKMFPKGSKMRKKLKMKL